MTCPSLSSKNRSTPTGGELVKYEKKNSSLQTTQPLKKERLPKLLEVELLFNMCFSEQGDRCTLRHLKIVRGLITLALNIYRTRTHGHHTMYSSKFLASYSGPFQFLGRTSTVYDRLCSGSKL